MIEILEQMPNQFFQFADDKEAKQLLFELGMIDKFTPKPNFKPSTTQILTESNHPTHFIAAMYFAGKTNPTDNGYLVFCLPKSQFSPEQAMAFVQKKMEGQGHPAVFKFLPGDSSQN
ncbi:MAG TPA: hypothetical protein VE344_06880 [Methylomirabilota bacterium]|nr:hypothetical protein [Methylomirabilota bacterium]